MLLLIIIIIIIIIYSIPRRRDSVLQNHVDRLDELMFEKAVLTHPICSKLAWDKEHGISSELMWTHCYAPESILWW